MIRRGGISLVRVIDDGCGMDRDDALLSLERHATSKIRTAADLAAIATLGFRGEALPSIASVSRFRLTTREPEAVAGTEIIVAGGKIETVRDGGEAPGTQVEVRSLFYNLPARRKFLRSENTESAQHRAPASSPGDRSSGDRVSRSSATSESSFNFRRRRSLLDRIRDLHGAELLARLLDRRDLRESAAVRISGLIGQAGVSRQTRAQQLVFVNGRAIESPVLTAALREGYHTALMKGQFPVTFLFHRARSRRRGCECASGETRSSFSRSGRRARSGRERDSQTLESGRQDWQQQIPIAGRTGGRCSDNFSSKSGHASRLLAPFAPAFATSWR